jgi:hypothetical protein
MAILSAELPKEDNVRILFWNKGGSLSAEIALRLESMVSAKLVLFCFYKTKQN